MATKTQTFDPKTAFASFEESFKAGKDAMTKNFEQAQAVAQKSYDEFSKLGKGNVDAVVQSGNVLAKGSEDFYKWAMQMTQASIEAGVENAKKLSGCKTAQEIVDVQSEFAKAQYDSLVAEIGKLNEMSQKVVTEASAPIKARVDLTVQTVTKPIAA